VPILWRSATRPWGMADSVVVLCGASRSPVRIVEVGSGAL